MQVPAKQLPVLWVVQSNLGNTETHDSIQEICRRNGFGFQSVTVVPFANELPDLSYAGPVLFYGATQWIRKIATAKKWTPGVFFDEESFTVSRCIEEWHYEMANHDAAILPIGDVDRLALPQDQLLFVRPNGDFKEFAGEIMTFGKLREWAGVLCAGGLELDALFTIVVARPKPIGSEWRIFAVEAKIVDATRYRVNGRRSVEKGAPPAVLEFAQSRLNEWMPVPALALDVAEVDGELKILELSDIHSCGHYAASVEDVIVAVSRVAELRYQAST
jgi:hypothetical protein